MRNESQTTTIDSLTIFAFLWAAATIFHQAKWDYWALSYPDLVLSLSAYWLLFRSRSLIAFATLILVQLWATFDQLPWVSNHFLFTAFANLTILFAFVRSVFSKKGNPIDRSKLFHDFAPVVRTELIILYFWTFFHKLNTDWFRPDMSCGAALYQKLAERLAFLPATNWILEVAIYSSLITEIAIPVLLIIRRTRVAGLIIAGAFHFIIGITGIFNFSAMLFAVLFLFVPDNFLALLREWWICSSIRYRLLSRVSPTALHTGYRRLTRVLFAIAVAILFSQFSWKPRPPMFILATGLPPDSKRSIFSFGFEALWWVYGLALIAIFLFIIRLGKLEWQEVRKFFKLPHASFVIAVLLVFFNGLSPYLGLKTEISFSMYSSLLTEGEVSNHLIIPRTLQLASYQDELVTIIHTSDPELQLLADLGYRLPYFEFRSYVSRKAQVGMKDISVTYRLGDRERSIMRVDEDPELLQPDSFFLRKLLRFRPVPPVDKNTCNH